MHCSPRLQGLAQTRGGQRPEVQVPFAQPQVPPQLSLAPQVPSVGHLGTQQRPCAQRALPEQPQVPPQPFVAPQVPSVGHAGTQQRPRVQRPAEQPLVPPQPSAAP